MFIGFIHGHLLTDVEIKVLPKGGKVANFRVASNHVYKDDQDRTISEMTPIDVEAYNGAAEVIAKYFVKGSEITLTGPIRLNAWEDKETRTPRSKHVLRVDKFDFCGGTKRLKAAGNEGVDEPSEAELAATGN